jgi:hypothetical protein
MPESFNTTTLKTFLPNTIIFEKRVERELLSNASLRIYIPYADFQNDTHCKTNKGSNFACFPSRLPKNWTSI